jgi:hypothetical protein
LACIPKAGSERAIDSAEELVGLIKVRQLVSSLRSFLQTKSEFFAEAQHSNRPRLVAKVSAPIDERVAAIAVLWVFIAVEYVGATARALNDLLTVIGQLEKPEQGKADRIQFCFHSAPTQPATIYRGIHSQKCPATH